MGKKNESPKEEEIKDMFNSYVKKWLDRELSYAKSKENYDKIFELLSKKTAENRLHNLIFNNYKKDMLNKGVNIDFRKAGIVKNGTKWFLNDVQREIEYKLWELGATFRVENWKGKEVEVVRDTKGKFIKWKKL